MNTTTMWRRLREASAAASSGTLERGAAAEDEKTCPTCKGDGKIMGGSRTCPDCDGSGTVPKDFKEAAARFAADVLDLEPLRHYRPAWDGGALREADVARLAEKDYSTDKRVELAKAGKAIPVKDDKGEVVGGSYPIDDGADLEDAISSFGRNPTAEVKAHIVSAAKRLGMTDKLPADWEGSTQKTKEAEPLLARVERLEGELRLEHLLREAKPTTLSATFSNPTRVQTAGGQEGYRVVLIREGRGNTEDDNFYSAAAIREMCESGVAEGMQAYANHPSLDEEETRPERDVRALVGHYRDVTFQESGGVPRAEAVFVPLTTDEAHPTYGWVVTLAEAASQNTGPQPLAGISLYGLSAGDYGPRPDGSEGRVVSLIRPSSGDIVTNAGAGGEFIRARLAESARRNATNQRREQRVTAAEHQQKLAEAITRLREAQTDEARTTAIAALDALQKESIDAPPKPIDSLEALTEAAPAVAERLREAAKQDATQDVAGLRQEVSQLREALGAVTETKDLVGYLREAEVTDEREIRGFVAKARERGLKTKEEVADLVRTERGFADAMAERQAEKLRESLGDLFPEYGEVEGVLGREPETAPANTGLDALREAGVPIKVAS